MTKIIIKTCDGRYKASTDADDLDIYAMSRLVFAVLNAAGYHEESIKEVFK